MKMFSLVTVMLLNVLSFHANAQPYTVPGAQIQPAWVFPLWFEDFNGDKDTIYFCYDPSSHNDVLPIPDSIYGEQFVDIDTSAFHASLTQVIQLPPGWGLKTIVVPGLPGGYIYFTKGRMPLKVKWDRNLFYDPVLLNIPLPDLLPNPLIEVLCPCNDFDPTYNNCPSGGSIPLVFIPEDPFNYFPEGIETDSMLFMGDTIGPNSLVSWLSLPMEFKPYQFPAGLNDNIDKLRYTIYPNPASNLVTISSSIKELRTFTLLNTLGQPVLSGDLQFLTQELNISMLSAGMYQLRVQTAKENVFNKILKQ